MEREIIDITSDYKDVIKAEQRENYKMILTKTTQKDVYYCVEIREYKNNACCWNAFGYFLKKEIDLNKKLFEQIEY